jgi:hypothetical protein
MSLFDLPELNGPDLGAQYAERAARPVVLSEADQETVSALLAPRRPLLVPCRACSRHVLIRPTTDSPARAFCTGCDFPPTECTCERIPYAST